MGGQGAKRTVLDWRQGGEMPRYPPDPRSLGHHLVVRDERVVREGAVVCEHVNNLDVDLPGSSLAEHTVAGLSTS